MLCLVCVGPVSNTILADATLLSDTKLLLTKNDVETIAFDLENHNLLQKEARPFFRKRQ